MPSVWSWNQSVAARWSLAYWKPRYPASQTAPSDAFGTLFLKIVVVGANRREAGGDIVRGGQVPGLGVAVALLGAVAAVQMRHDRHRARCRDRAWN